MLIALMSAKGAPGVTTTALALALRWPRPVLLVEADLAGSSILPGYFGGQVPHDRGLAMLAAAHARGELAAALEDEALPLTVTGDGMLIPGLRGPHAAGSALDLWAPLAHHLVGLERNGMDAIVDLGRFGVGQDPREIVLRFADQAVLVTRSRLPDVVVAVEAARVRLGNDPAARESTNLSCLVVGPGRPYGAAEIARSCGLASVGEIGWDPLGADVLAVGERAGRRFESGPLMRSVQTVIEEVSARAVERRHEFAGTGVMLG